MRKAYFVGVVSWVLGAGALANCVDANNNVSAPPSTDAGAIDARVDAFVPPPGDASGDSTVADAHAPVDSGVDAPSVPPDAGVSPDAADASDSADAADSADASDAQDAPDAAPTLDDAGCPVPTGVTVNVQDAGIPATGLVLWLRSDIGVNTINGVADGGSVCRWDDVSGNGQSFTPAGAIAPTRLPSALGAMPAVSFNGSGQNLSRAGVLGIAPTSARTFAVYSKTPDTTHRFESVFQGQDGTPGIYFGLDANTFLTAGSLEGVYVTNNSYDSDLATTTNARTHILSISSFVPGTPVPAALTYAVDGTVRTLTTSATNANSLVQDFSGANFTSVGYGAAGFTSGMIGEVLVYDRELTAAERLLIEQHFAGRF